MKDDDFAIRLMRAQSAANLNATQLAALIGVDKGVLSRWQQGKITPSFRLLPVLATALNVTTDYLCGLSEEGPK